MNMKRILVLVMTFAMLISTFAPTLGVFADYVAGNGDNGEDGTLDYVSLGDSMTNGIGMSGYDTTDNPGTDNDGRNGYLEVAPDAYPAQFAKWLKTFTGKDVNLTQLATSGVRVEDVYYILNHGTENAFEPDAWTENELLWNSDRWGDPTNQNDAIFNDEIAEVHREAVKNADIISLATGNGNFGVFMIGRIMNLVGFGDADDVAKDAERYGHYTVENALALCGANEELTKLVMDTYNSAIEYLAEMGVPETLVTKFADLLTYTTASYAVYSMKVMDLIVDMNPDVTLIVVPLINNGLDFNFDVTLNGITKHFNAGDFLGALYTPLNAFIAAYPTAKQATGEYADATFLYAELPENTQVETFAQAFDKLYEAVPKNATVDTYPANRLFCHNRFYEDIQGFVMPILLGGEASDYKYKFDEYDIRAYEIAMSNGTEAFLQYVMNNSTVVTSFEKEGETVKFTKAQLIAYYLGIVDAVLTSVASTANVNVDDITVEEGTEFSIFSILGPYVTEVPGKIEANIANRLANDENNTVATIYGMVGDYGTAVKVASLTVLPAAMSEELTNVGLLEALLALYGRLKFAWGLAAHPSAAGHDTLTESLVNAYENNYTCQDETVENAKEALILALKATDEAYQYGYDYVDNAGYIDNAVAVLDKVIARLELVDLSDNGPMTEEFKAEMHKEIDAMIATLEEIKNALANDDAEDLEGLVATLYALLDDVLVHLANIYDLCAQAGIDVNQLVIIPALKEALEIIETELIPALEQLVEEFIDAVVAHVTEKAEALYSYALGLTKEAYEALVEVIVRIQLHVEEKVDEIIDTVLDQYFAVLEQLTEIYGDVEYALNIVIEVYRAVADFVAEHGDEIVDGLEIAKVVFVTVYDFLVEHGEDVKVAFEVAVKVYTAVVEFVVANAEDIEKALEIAGKAFDYVLEAAKYVYENAEEIYAIASEVYATLVEVIVKVNSAVETAIDVYNYVYDLLVDIFGSIENAACIAKKVCALVVEFIKNTPEMLENAYQLFLEIYDVIVEAYGYSNDALEAANAAYKYVLCVLTAVSDDIKDAIYNAENADYTITEDSYYVALGNAAYAEELAEMLYLEGKFAQYGLAGDYTADLENADLVTVKFNNGEFYQFAYTQVVGTVAGLVRSNALVMEYYELYSDVVDAALAEYGLSINTEAQELDWSKYMDAETLAIFEDRLDAAAAQLVAAGFPEVYALDLTDVISAQLPAGFVVEEDIVIEIPVAELIVYAVENALYAYAETVGRVVNTLAEIYEVAPEATVVITGINNSTLLFADLVAGFAPEAVEYVVALDDAVELLNLPLYAYAVLNENTIFVNSDSAEDIYAALHAHCAHAYDDCADTVCNICGETRVAPGHVWGEWVTVEEATTEKEGTAERTCEVCGATETKSIDKLPVDDDNQGGDNTGDDNKGEDNTQTPVVDDEKGGLAPWAIVAISVGSVAVACGAGALVYWFVIKKKRA